MAGLEDEAVNDKPLVAMLVKAMQQLSARVTALEAGAAASPYAG